MSDLKHVNHSCENDFIYGTMRLDEISSSAAVDLLAYLLKKGVRKFHSSTEYSSFAFFADSLKQACEKAQIEPESLQHVVKLASPHFDEVDIDEEKIETLINQYRTSLNVETIYLVQWMARIDLQKEDARLKLMQRDSEKLSAIAQSLKEKNYIREFGCFPYTKGFARLAIKSGAFDCMIDYYNPSETSARDYFTALQDANMSFVALRSFYAGKSFEEGHTLDDLVKFAFTCPVLDGVVISTNKVRHFDEINYALSSDW